MTELASSLRRASGDAIVRVNRAEMPKRKKPIVLREPATINTILRCEDYPMCNGSITIIDHDLKQKGGVTAHNRQYVSHHKRPQLKGKY